ncbi:hypothetical protein DPMN_116534 [Dreissena polymorpha]|uniref:Uncharacterized protein n=1 Tax=Dreissena polymorpha TaxID=45954 RepID=A0A9D4KPL7_DREPO|nr:hypothetical protein DPMN_116534 [Dreissena polymorpha]
MLHTEHRSRVLPEPCEVHNRICIPCTAFSIKKSVMPEDSGLPHYQYNQSDDSIAGMATFGLAPPQCRDSDAL